MRLLRVALISAQSILAVARLAVQPIGLLRQTSAVVDERPLQSTKELEKLYPEHSFSAPIDHFHNDSLYVPHSDEFFNLRFWFDASHYREGGPVIILAAGEEPGTDRLPFLHQGIVAQLASALGGIGVILEHRYYGTSFPTANLSTESLRFLTTDQALADTAIFAQNVVFPGLEYLNVTASKAPWIAYGGSYAGAFVAFARKLYPDVFWGAISSSGVTEAIEEYREYFEPIRQYGSSDCVWTTQVLTKAVDRILIKSQNRTLRSQLKSAFGLSEVRHDADFANILTHGILRWQHRNWDPAVGSPGSMYYCSNLTHASLLYPSESNLTSSIIELLTAVGYGDNSTLVTRMLNWIGYTKCVVNTITSSSCFSGPAPNGNPPDLNAFFTTDSSKLSIEDSLTARWRSGLYQVCTQWGYFLTGSGSPPGTLPLISGLIDLPYASQHCSQIFNITTSPNVTATNKHGGVNFSFPRVAIIDGLTDPWRPVTPHADKARSRKSTDEEPFILMDAAEEEIWDGMRGAVHHWDANGLWQDDGSVGVRISKVPRVVEETQKEILRFVRVWIEQFWEDKGQKRREYDEECVKKDHNGSTVFDLSGGYNRASDQQVLGHGG
jgi:Serine carboxypeptidase S28